MIKLSIVTFNRRDVLKRTLEAIEKTCQGDAYEVLVTDNGSTDGTGEMLKEMEAQGRLAAWLLKENRGTAFGRNAHWAECIGHDSVRLDDKALPLVPGWLRVLKWQADNYEAILAVPYDPTVLHLWHLAPMTDYIKYESEQGQGGPVIFIPATVTVQLGGVDELHPDIKYGWDDCLYIERAKLLGWKFGFSLRARFEWLASASPAARAKAMEYHGLHVERLRQYREAERDLYLDVQSTEGYGLGKEARP